ncbi:MAG: hypothetical protein HY902_20055 [Deltaproteobacteria bacterium]|nr:hypothetical protein [Deltaproteobacteria bacterium]
MLARLFVFFSLAVVAACSASPGGAGGMMAGCVPNTTQLCYCSATLQGIQNCAPAGDAWSLCSCATPTDAGGDTTTKGDAASSPDQSGGGSDTGSATVADTSSEPDIDWSELLDPEDTGSEPADTAASDQCPERAKIIYVVTKGNQLLSFSPDTLQFKLVGTLGCPAGVGNTPFSMAVDRKANAYVLYQSFTSGAGVFKVSTLDASCTGTAYQPNLNGFEVFGMGFSSDAPAIADETLWIGGTKALSFQAGPCKLGTLDVATLKTKAVATIPAAYGCPDLTGNGQAQLFGFFPNANPPAVGQIDKQTAQITKNWPLPASLATTEAWAFAQWGGKLWLFAKTSAEINSSVWSLDPLTGITTKALNNIGHVVVGAGVSSCAPTGN